MLPLQLATCRTLDRTWLLPVSNHHCSSGGSHPCLNNHTLPSRSVSNNNKIKYPFNVGRRRVFAMSSESNSSFKMNLREYMVTLDKPFGIRLALSADGNVFVHALKKGGNAEQSRIVMVGDLLKKAFASFGGDLIEIKDYGHAEKLMKEKSGSYSLLLERPSFPFPIHKLYNLSDLDVLFNRGRVPIATWNKNLMSSNLQTSSESSANHGILLFSSKFLTSKGLRLLNNQTGFTDKLTPSISQLACIFYEEDSEDENWGYGSFPLNEYINALERSKEEMPYDHSIGMRYSKVTEQLYVGSCIQTDADVETLSKVVGVSAIINFQGGVEAENWGIDPKSINESCERNDILMINYHIRDGDSFDTRKKLPFCVGLLLRLLKKNHRVFVTCTSGLDRSPTCVIAYLHWMTDTSLNAAYNFVTGLHVCKPDRPAIAWATWDLIAMAENGVHDGPPTHAVTFVWNGQEGEDVNLVGDFTGNWKEPVRAVHQGGSRYEVEIRLPHGRYYYKYIVNGQWRHSTNSPSERDERGNVNNIIVIGDTASVRPSILHPKKDVNIIKVIERPLTENERFTLAKAARCVAFYVCPVQLAPK